MSNPQIHLRHPDTESAVIEFDPMDNKKPWVQRMVLLPWTTPQRLLGFVHPAADKDVGHKPFLLHGAFAYYGSVGMQQIAPDKIRAVEGPKILLPYDLITPVDVQIYTCPMVIWIREQNERFQELFGSLLMQQMNPPRIEIPSPATPSPIIKP